MILTFWLGVVTPIFAPVHITPAQIASVKATLENSLRDYEGSRFRGFRAVRVGQRLTLCGEGNMRNAMGGMTGWNPVAVTVEGDPFGQRVIAVASNGYTGLSDYTKVCVYTGPSGSVGPENAEVGADDLTSALQPAAGRER